MSVYTVESVAQKLTELAAPSLGKQPSEIERGTPLDAQGVDSLAFAEFIFEVEDAFGVEVANEKKVHDNMRTINDLAAYIVARQPAAA